MIPRGKPFPHPPGPRPRVLYCPACMQPLRANRIFALPPEDRADAPDLPFVRYTCEVTGCGYAEIHGWVLMEGA